MHPVKTQQDHDGRPCRPGDPAPELPGEPETCALRLWRDHDPRSYGIRGIAMGKAYGGGDPRVLAQELFAEGVRRVEFDRPVDLSGAARPHVVVDRMILIQELTAWGMVVDWTVRWGKNLRIWEQLQHLYPPRLLGTGPDGAGRLNGGVEPGGVEPDGAGEQDGAAELSRWRESFYLCKCCYRRGPGFLQVRDRRSGVLERFIIDEPRYLAAVERLLTGAPTQEIPQDILRDFTHEGLAGVAGPLAWWLPYRVRRWPWPAVMV